MAKNIKNTANASAPSFADAIAIRNKADQLLADAEKAMAAFQAKAWEVLAAKGAATEVMYVETDNGVTTHALTYQPKPGEEKLGTGLSASGTGTYNGTEFSFFSRWNRKEERPTLVFKGLFASPEKAEKKSVIQF